MQAKERVIFDSINNVDLESVREAFVGQLVDQAGMTESEAREILSDGEVLSRGIDAIESRWNSETNALCDLFGDLGCDALIVKGSVRSSVGSRKGLEDSYWVVDDVDELFFTEKGAIFQGCDRFKIGDVNGHLFARGKFDSITMAEVKMGRSSRALWYTTRNSGGRLRPTPGKAR